MNWKLIILIMALLVSDGFSLPIIQDFLEMKNCAIPTWNIMGPYGGDRKNVIIDPHNPNILFVNSCDDSGVWISKTAGESTNNQYNPAWQHTKLDRGYTEIASTYDENYTYIFAVMNKDNHVYRLKYNVNQDPSTKDWEKITFAREGENLLEVTIISDPYRCGRLIIYALDKSNRIFKLFQSIEYGGKGSWNEIDFTMPPVEYDKNIGIYVSDFDFDPNDENLLYLSLIYSNDIRLASTLFSYDLEKSQWKKLSAEIYALITSFSITDDKIYMTLSYSMNHTIVVGKRVGDNYTWEYRNIVLEDGATLPSSCNAIGIVVAPHNSSILFLGITGSMDNNVSDLGVRGLYKSVDGGRHWKRVAQPTNAYMCYLKGNSISFNPVNPKIMYAGMTNFDCIRKSTDYGETWYPITEGLSGINVFGVATAGNKVYGVVQSAIAINNNSLATNHWVYRQITSPDGKVTANLYGGVEIDPFDESIVLVGAGHRYATLSRNGGIFRNANYGYSNTPTEWERVLYDSDPNDGLSNPQIMDIYFSKTTPGLVFAAAMINKATMKGERGLYVSFDHGLTWDWIYKDSDMYHITQDPFDSNIYYAVGSGTNGGGKVVKIIVEGNKIELKESRVFLFDDYFYSIDIQRGLPLEKTYAFVGTEKGRILKIPLLKLRKVNLCINLYGSNKKIIHGFKGTSAVVAVNPNRPNEVFVGLYNGGVYRSIDAGLTWRNYSQGLTSSAINIFELKFSSDGKRLFAGTLGGVAVLVRGTVKNLKI